MDHNGESPVWINCLYWVIADVRVPVPTLRILQGSVKPWIDFHKPSQGGGVVSSQHVIQPAFLVALVAGERAGVQRRIRLRRSLVAEGEIVMRGLYNPQLVDLDAGAPEVIDVVEHETRRRVVADGGGATAWLASNGTIRGQVVEERAFARSRREIRPGGEKVGIDPQLDVAVAADESGAVAVGVATFIAGLVGVAASRLIDVA